MKQFLKRALLPLAVLVVAVVSAFAMNSKVAPEQFQPLYTGPFGYYHPISGDCTNIPTLNPVTVDCTLVVTSITCTVNLAGVGTNIHLRSCIPDLPFSGIWTCVMPLYKRTVLRAS